MSHPDPKATGNTTIDLGDAGSAIAGSWGRIAFVTIVAGLLGACFAALCPEPSVVESRILVEPTREAANVRAASADDDHVFSAQMNLLASADFLERVATAAGGGRDAVRGEAARAETVARENRVDMLRDHLSIERVDRTRLVSLRIRTTEIETARRLLDVAFHEYSDLLHDTKARAGAEVDRRFAAEIDAARKAASEVRVARSVAAPSPAQPETVAVPMPTPAPTRASAFDDPERAALMVERKQAREALAALEKLAASGDVERALDLAPTPAMQRLRDRRTALRARLAELSTVYLEKHPLVKEANGQIADLHREIQAELPRAVAARRLVVADLDRRIAELAATATASIPAASAAVASPAPQPQPVPPVAEAASPEAVAAEAAFVDVLARRDAALAEALGQAAVEVRQIQRPVVVAGFPQWQIAVWGGSCAGGGLLLAFFFVALKAGRRTDVAHRGRRYVHEEEAARHGVPEASTASRSGCAAPVAPAPQAVHPSPQAYSTQAVHPTRGAAGTPQEYGHRDHAPQEYAPPHHAQQVRRARRPLPTVPQDDARAAYERFWQETDEPSWEPMRPMPRRAAMQDVDPGFDDEIDPRVRAEAVRPPQRPLRRPPPPVPEVWPEDMLRRAQPPRPAPRMQEQRIQPPPPRMPEPPPLPDEAAVERTARTIRDAERRARATLYEQAVVPLVRLIRREIARDVEKSALIVVVATRDDGRSLGAARAIAADVAGVHGSAGLVEELGFADVLDRRIAFTDALRLDRRTGVRVLRAAERRLGSDELVGEGVRALIEAIRATSGAVVVDAGKLVPGSGVAAMLALADVVVMAEDATRNRRARAAYDGLVANGKVVWLLDPDVGDERPRRAA